MLKTLLNAIIIVTVFIEMRLVNSSNNDSPIVIRNDRVYRYIENQNPSESILLSDINDEEPVKAKMMRSKEIPESILIQLKDIKDTSEFIENFLDSPNNTDTKANTDDIYLEYLHRGNSELSSNIADDRRKMKKLPKISNPAGCTTEMKIIEMNNKKSHNEMYFPMCVRLPRCSGCCPSERLQCAPIKKSFEDVTVIKVKYSPLAKKFTYNGFTVFRIEKHDNCSCECIQKASQCSSTQKYVPEECRCMCSDTDKAKKCRTQFDKVWDNQMCECKCQFVSLCSTGFVFNNDTCRCVPEYLPFSNSVDNSTNSIAYDNYTRENISDILERDYPKRESENREVIQRNKGINIFNIRGINPETDSQDENLHN